MGYTPYSHDFVNLKQYGKTRNLREVGLAEGSLIALRPMNPAADVDTASVKTLAQWPEMDEDERKAYIASLSDTDRTALRALLEPAPEPGPALAPEALVQEARKALVRLNLQQLATRVRGSAPVGQNIATMSDRTDEHFRKAG
jgi:hypothetical protein